MTATATRPQAGTEAAGGLAAGARVLQRVVLPVDGDQDVLPLYADGQLVSTGALRPDGTAATAPMPGTAPSLDQVTGRTRFAVPSGERVSFASYFNAFPASYWRRWSVVDAVRLVVRTAGTGTVVVYRSNAKGNVQRVAAEVVTGEASSSFDLPLKPFTDGGWYWFDLAAGSEPLELVEAAWVAGESPRPSPPAPAGA